MQLSTIGKYVEKKTQHYGFRWFLNLFLILVIYGNAQFTYQLGQFGYPVAISPVWPPAGIALAALLMFGKWVLPGIFLGVMSHNLPRLLEGEGVHIASFAVSFAMAAGSTLQAYIAARLIQRHSTDHSFSRVRDVVFFLLPGGLFSCLIASSIGTTALYLDDLVTSTQFWRTWFTFWIGDTVGVYIFTPLIVVWSIFKPIVLLKKYRVEAFLMAVGFIGVTLLTYVVRNYPLAHLFLPLAFWATFRFRMHGATLSVFFLLLVMVIPTALGQGPYLLLATDPVLLIVTYVGMIAVLMLLLAALLNEYDEALSMLQRLRIGQLSAEETFTLLSGEEEQIAVPINVTGVSISLEQNVNVQFDAENMYISATKRGETVQMHVAFK